MDSRDTKHFVNVGDHRICYVEGGDPRKPPLLLLHGWLGSHQLYRRCFPALAHRYRYRALDLPGFGDSDKPSPSTTAYDPKWYAEQLNAFLDAVQLKKTTICAQSMGAIVATEFALRHPDRVEKLVLVDAAGVYHRPPLLGRLLVVPGLGRALFTALGATRRALVNFMCNDVWYVKDGVFEDAVIDEMERVLRLPGAKQAAHAALLRMISQPAVRGFTPQLARLQVPVRLIWGEHDRLFPVGSCGREMAKLIVGASLQIVPGAGHEPPAETPAAFLAALERATA